jgi:hypothetical protein
VYQVIARSFAERVRCQAGGATNDDAETVGGYQT